MLLWRHEFRRAGWPACTAPPATLLVTLAMAALAAGAGAPRAQIARLLLAGAEALLPLAAGMAAATVIARDGCRELQLALPARHARTLARRLGWLVMVSALVSALFCAGLRLTGWWTGPGPWASALVWGAPLVWLGGLAALVAVAGRGLVPSATAIGVVWLAEQVFASWFAGHVWSRPWFLFMTTRAGAGPGWGANRAVLMGSGLLFVIAARVLLRRPERLLTEEEA
jgi:hypothetical protein